ncbi:F-BAR domain only protein 1 isoform X2 [Ambystoma mexicanum]|uniref:F-BAR domain only protein 1 isoform X2 n=1 Tax=Ambystoma mexicanum TaxID=8296 RepID=UPI0037E867A2
MAYFGEHFWGDKNMGFGVLYHNMKHGQISTKELADFVRERATIEETYSKSMVKLSRLASNSSLLGTFSPVWELFRVSSDKLALCHQELVKKLHDLIKEINRYGEEQVKVHKKSKEEVSGTLEAVQALHNMAQLLQKSKENYCIKIVEYERLRKEGVSQKEVDKAEIKSKKAAEALRRAVDKYNLVRNDFELKMQDSAQRFQELEDVHLRHMKVLISCYSHSIEDTHVQIGQVHEEFKQNMENICIDNLLKKFAENKGTGREKPGAVDFDICSIPSALEGVKRSRVKPFRIPGLSRKEKGAESVESQDVDGMNCPEVEVDEEGFTLRPDMNRNEEQENNFCSSSDSDFDDNEGPRRFHIQIKPFQPRDENCNTEAAVEELRATVGSLILPSSTGVTMKRNSRHTAVLNPASIDADPEAFSVTGEESRKLPAPSLTSRTSSSSMRSSVEPQEPLFGPPLESAFEQDDLTASGVYVLTSSPSLFSSSPENVEDSGLDSPSHAAPGPSPDSRPWTPRPVTPQSPATHRTAKDSPVFLEDKKSSTPALCSHPYKRPDRRAWRPRPGSSPPSPTNSSQRDSFTAFSYSTFESNTDEDSGQWTGASGPRSSRPGGLSGRSLTDPFFRTLGAPCVSASSLEGLNSWRTRPKSPARRQPSDGDASVSSNSISSSSSPTSLPAESSSPSQCNHRLSGSKISERESPPCRLSAPETSITVDLSLVQSDAAFIDGLTVAPPLQRPRSKRVSSGLRNGGLSRSLTPSPSLAPSPLSVASGSLCERSFFISPQLGLGHSRGPSPVVLGSQDALPVAAAFTEYIHSYFKGEDQESCLVKITGEVTMSFPAGIVRVFIANPPPPVLSFRLVNTTRIEQFLPNSELLYSDLSQSDLRTKDFWLNMPALTGNLQRQSEQAPGASYYNVALLKYQVSKPGFASTPLRLAASWICDPSSTRVKVEYTYNSGAMTTPVPLTNIQVLLPVEEQVTNVELHPAASWSFEDKRLLWRLPDISEGNGHGGSGHLSASWEPLSGPSKPGLVAVQFTSEGSTLSGVDMELVGSGYRMSLVKKRFATGKYLAGC